MSTPRDWQEFEVRDFPLAKGGVLARARIAYVTHGTLSPAKDNAILIPTWYSGTHQIWADAYVGEGHALDPSRYGNAATGACSGLLVDPCRSR